MTLSVARPVSAPRHSRQAQEATEQRSIDKGGYIEDYIEDYYRTMRAIVETPLRGGIQGIRKGATIGLIKRDTRSLDYSSTRS